MGVGTLMTFSPPAPETHVSLCIITLDNGSFPRLYSRIECLSWLLSGSFTLAKLWNIFSALSVLQGHWPSCSALWLWIWVSFFLWHLNFHSFPFRLSCMFLFLNIFYTFGARWKFQHQIFVLIRQKNLLIEYLQKWFLVTNTVYK